MLAVAAGGSPERLDAARRRVRDLFAPDVGAGESPPAPAHHDRGAWPFRRDSAGVSA
jgi:hypothetical protein